MPTQNEENWLVPGHVPCIAGTVHDPLASLTEPEDPVTAYPLQFVLVKLPSCWRGERVHCGIGIAEAAMRKDRTINAVALADETDIVCSFIFKKSWDVNNLDKICGTAFVQMSQMELEEQKNQ